LWSVDLQSSAIVIAVFEFVLLLFSLSVHESAHAWMASRLGDQTARMLGRVSLNPMDHVDPIGTLLIPALAIFGPFIGLGFLSGYIIGWAKPVPIISRNFLNFKRDDMLVSLAGPASNLLLALLAFAGLAILEVTIPDGRNVVPSTLLAAIFRNGDVVTSPLVLLCATALVINLCLCIFNLLPIPPLDGSHILRNVLPYGAVRVFDSITGPLSYILLIFVGGAVMRVLFTPMLAMVFWGLIHL
jgi:Zn-dependent protease